MWIQDILDIKERHLVVRDVTMGSYVRTNELMIFLALLLSYNSSFPFFLFLLFSFPSFYFLISFSYIFTLISALVFLYSLFPFFYVILFSPCICFSFSSFNFPFSASFIFFLFISLSDFFLLLGFFPFLFNEGYYILSHNYRPWYMQSLLLLRENKMLS